MPAHRGLGREHAASIQSPTLPRLSNLSWLVGVIGTAHLQPETVAAQLQMADFSFALLKRFSPFGRQSLNRWGDEILSTPAQFASSESDFGELLLGAVRVPDVPHGLFVRPALFPRLAQSARGRLARFDSPLCEIGFHRLSRMTRVAARRSFLATRRFSNGRKWRHHCVAATSVSLRLCAMIQAAATSTRGLTRKSSAMLRRMAARLWAVGLPLRPSIR